MSAVRAQVASSAWCGTAGESQNHPVFFYPPLPFLWRVLSSIAPSPSRFSAFWLSGWALWNNFLDTSGLMDFIALQGIFSSPHIVAITVSLVSVQKEYFDIQLCLIWHLWMFVCFSCLRGVAPWGAFTVVRVACGQAWMHLFTDLWNLWNGNNS